MITAKNIIKSFKNGDVTTTVLRGISLDIQSGEFVAIMGKSGAGKSTLMYQLGLLDHPTSGDVFIDDLNVTQLSHDARTKFRLDNLGYIFQDYAILPSLTALENTVLPLLMQGFSDSVAYKKAKAALDRIGLSDRMNNLPSQLSGGQQQRVAIARAIAHEPKIIFADEPTANLDSETSDQVINAFIELNKEGQTIVMVTHEPEYAALAHRTILMADGSILEDRKNR